MSWVYAITTGIEDIGGWTRNNTRGNVRTGFVDENGNIVMIAQQDGTASGWYYAYSTDDGATWNYNSLDRVNMPSAHTSPTGEFFYDRQNSLLFAVYQDSAFDVGFHAMAWDSTTPANGFSAKASGRYEPNASMEFGPLMCQFGYNTAGDPMIVGVLADGGSSSLIYHITVVYDVSLDSWSGVALAQTWSTSPNHDTGNAHMMVRRYDLGEDPDVSTDLQQALTDGDVFWVYQDGTSGDAQVRGFTWDSGNSRMDDDGGTFVTLIDKDVDPNEGDLFFRGCYFDPVDQIWVMAFLTRDSAEATFDYPFYLWVSDGPNLKTCSWTEVYNSREMETTNEWTTSTVDLGKNSEYFLNPVTGVFSVWALSTGIYTDWTRHDITYKGAGAGTAQFTNEGWQAVNADFNNATYLNRVQGFNATTDTYDLGLTASIFDSVAYGMWGYDLEQGWSVLPTSAFTGWGIPMGIA